MNEKHVVSGSFSCPKCGFGAQVIETRSSGDDKLRRRRRCNNCGYRFTTYESRWPRVFTKSPDYIRGLAGNLRNTADLLDDAASQEGASDA